MNTSQVMEDNCLKDILGLGCFKDCCTRFNVSSSSINILYCMGGYLRTVYCKSFEVEKFCGFHGSIGTAKLF